MPRLTDAPIFGKLQVDQACGFLVISEFLNGHFSFEHDKAVLIGIDAKEAYEREGNKVEPSRRIYSREYDKNHPESVYYSRIKAGAKQFAVASSEKFRKSIQAHGTERYVEDLKIIRQLIDDAIEKYQKKQ